MNVWILNHYAKTPDVAGSTRHFDFARELVKRGYQISIFASGFSHRSRNEERLNKRQNYQRENTDGVGFIWVKTIPYYGGNDWRRVLNMLSYCYRVIPLGIKLKEKPDVIIGSSPHPFAGVAGWILAKFKRARFILEIRDLWPQALIDIGNYRNKSLSVRFLGILERFLYRKAEKILVAMPKAADYITTFGISDSKIIYLPQEVSSEFFANTHDCLPEKLNKNIVDIKSKGKLIAGYTGAHGVADNLNTVVEAASLLQEERADKVHFLLVGDGPEKKKLVEKANNLGLKNISFYESVPKSVMPALLLNMDIAIVTKKKSGLYKYGISFLKLFDYMASATPVIWAVKSDDNPVSDANCGVTIQPEDPEALANAIIKMCGLSAEERREMGMKGYDYVMEYHAVPVLVDKLVTVLEDKKL